MLINKVLQKVLSDFSPKEGKFVLRKNIEIDSDFRALKTYLAELWFIKNRKRYLIFSVSSTGKVVNDKDDTLNVELYTILLSKLFSIVQTDEWKKLIEDGDITAFK